MAPIAATWSKPLTTGGAPCHGSWPGPHHLDGDGHLDPSCVPGILLHGKLDTTPIDGLIGLCHAVHVC